MALSWVLAFNCLLFLFFFLIFVAVFDFWFFRYWLIGFTMILFSVLIWCQFFFSPCHCCFQSFLFCCAKDWSNSSFFAVFRYFAVVSVIIFCYFWVWLPVSFWLFSFCFWVNLLWFFSFDLLLLLGWFFYYFWVNLLLFFLIISILF